MYDLLGTFLNTLLTIYIFTRRLYGSYCCNLHFDKEMLSRVPIVAESNKLQSLDSKHGHPGPDPGFDHHAIMLKEREGRKGNPKQVVGCHPVMKP